MSSSTSRISRAGRGAGRIKWLALVGAAVLLVAAGLTLRPTRSTDTALFAKARAAAGQSQVSDISIDNAQSFRVVDGAHFKGLLVTGTGQLQRADADPVRGCFVVAVSADGRSHFIPTIGADNWEAESCIGLKAVGQLDADSAGAQRLVLIYDAASPNATTIEPVVVRWQGQFETAEIDIAASDKASQHGVHTVAEVRKLLAPEPPDRSPS